MQFQVGLGPVNDTRGRDFPQRAEFHRSKQVAEKQPWVHRPENALQTVWLCGIPQEPTLKVAHQGPNE